MIGSYKYIFSIQQQTKQKEMNIPFNISIDIIKDNTMACMAQSLGQQVETRSHDSSAILETKCIMFTGIAYLTGANWQALGGLNVRSPYICPRPADSRGT